jgi:hypothetical protein
VVSKAVAFARRCTVQAAFLLCLILPATGAATGAPDAAANGRQIRAMLRIPPDHHRPSATSIYSDDVTIAVRRRLAQDIAGRYGLAFIGNGWQMKLLGLGCYAMQVGPNETVSSAVLRLSADRDILWSEPVQVYAAKASPTAAENDPLFAVQPAAAAWHLAALHRVATGRGVALAVVDSRAQRHHPDRAGQCAASRDFVEGRRGSAEA